MKCKAMSQNDPYSKKHNKRKLNSTDFTNVYTCSSTLPNMTNGERPYLPASGMHLSNGNTVVSAAGLLLKQMIVNDVKQPVVATNYDSRTTRIRHAPDGGAVQITYKKMIHTPHTYSSPVFILPKSTTSCAYSYSTSNNYQPISCQPESFSNKSFSSIQAPLQNTYALHNNIRPATTIETPVYNDPLTNSHLVHPTAISSFACRNNQLQQPVTHSNLTISLPKMSKIQASMSNANTLSIKTSNCDLNSNDAFRTAQSIGLQSNDPLMSSQTETLLDTQDLMATLDYEHDLLDRLDMNQFQQEVSLLKEKSSSNDLTSINGDLNSVFMCHEQPTIGEVPSSLYNVSDLYTSENMASDELLDIIDVSPEIATTSGGNKIILIGTWNAKNARYACRFGEIEVQAELIQNGVLKCYSPLHKACRVQICVLCNERVISKSLNFEFINIDNSDGKGDTDVAIKHEDWMCITDASFRNSLKERFLSIAEIIDPDHSGLIVLDPSSEYFEKQLIEFCKALMSTEFNVAFEYTVERTMTVLHIAACLGYLKLIQLLLNWVELQSNKIINVEACPTMYDQFHMLPIMWSAAKGHFNTTCVLLQWDEFTLAETDYCGCSIIELARECGHSSLGEYLERIKRKSSMSRENSDASSPMVSSSLVGSFDSQSRHVEGSSSPRTLGRTLAHIQSILKEQTERSEGEPLSCSDDEDASLFETSFTPRARSVSTELPFVTCSSKVVSINAPDRPSPPHHPVQSPFNRQVRETAEFCEFFYQAKKIEKDFAELTLTDDEQVELYHAANVIQTAYKTYKERRHRRDQELSAAVLIQSYYRRYKQYAAFKKMQKGAVVIQNQYRAHREKAKRKFQAASVIQSYYRRYRKRKHECSHLNQHADRYKNKRYFAHISKRFSQEPPDTFVIDSTTSMFNNVYAIIDT